MKKKVGVGEGAGGRNGVWIEREVDIALGAFRSPKRGELLFENCIAFACGSGRKHGP
jgi:hypothetical protein